MFDYCVVGAGYAGAVCARRLAEEGGKKILLIDRRKHIAGNMYDEYDENGILVHRYGPHISVMNEKRAYDFLSRFTEWLPYLHRVNAEIDGKEVPLPINFYSIDLLFPYEKARAIKSRLLQCFPGRESVPILEMKQEEDPVIRDFADYIYEKVFLHYTVKMWDLKPSEIDPSVTARIPVRLNYDNRHFTHEYQVMPKDGFTVLFRNMLDHPNITVRLETDAKDLFRVDTTTQKILCTGESFRRGIIYTGALDELFDYCFGELPYRSLKFEFGTHPETHVQDPTVLNWPDDRPATRRTEMKRLTQQVKQGISTTITEYPGGYVRGDQVWGEPLYPINKPENIRQYEQYKALLARFPEITPAGRLADYKYYNMEATVLRALDVSDELLKTCTGEEKE